MGIFNSYNDVDLDEFAKQESDKGFAAPINPSDAKEVGVWDGALSALPRGVAVGALKAGSTISKPLQRIKDTLDYTIKNDYNEPINVQKEQLPQYVERQSNERTKTTLGVIDEIEDKKNTGAVGQVLMGLGDIGSRAILGGITGGVPGAIALTGISTGDYTYNNLVAAGVDPKTASKVALTQGAVEGGFVAFPVYRGAGLLKNTGLITAPVAISQGGRELNKNILNDAGYDNQAKAYDFTKTGFATELALSIIFNRGTAYLHNRVKNGEISQDQADRISQEGAEAADDATIHLVNQLGREMDDTIIPRTDNIVRDEHSRQNLNTAMNQIQNGQPVRVPHQLIQEPKNRSIDFANSALPSNAKQIALKAQQEGINPSVALTIAHIETGGSFSHTAQPPKRNDGTRASTAHGLFQVLDKTWSNLGGKDRNSVDEQIRIGLKHIKQADAYMRKQLGRDPVESEQYLGHLLGPAGATKVLKADPNTPLIDVVRSYDPKNADAIVKNNGMAGMTAGEAINKWQGKWNQLSARYGDTSVTTAHDANGSAYDFAWEVRSLDDLSISNDAFFGVNPHYPAELQPRDRTREASRQQIDRMADDLKPELLGQSAKISDGAPISGLDGVIESGNGRMMAIRQAIQNGKADSYLQMVNDFANARGWDISGVKQPVLVRTRLSDVNRVEFARLANESDVAQMSASERSRTDADRLPDASLLRLNSEGNINLDGSMDFVRAFVDQIPQTERSAVLTGDGKLSQSGKQRIEQALAQKAYGDSNLVARLYENMDDNSRIVLNAMLRSAPQLAQLSDLVKQGGRYANTIAQDLAQAAQKLSDIKANGLRVDDFLNQGQLLDDGLSSGAKDFLRVFNENSRSSKAINDYIKTKIDEIDSKGDPRQGSLFGDSPDGIAAMQILQENPEMIIQVSRLEDDGSISSKAMTIENIERELKIEAEQADLNNIAVQAAINCALKFGE